MRIDFHSPVQIQNCLCCLVQINVKQGSVDEQIGVLWIQVNALRDQMKTVFILEFLEKDEWFLELFLYLGTHQDLILLGELR